MSEDYRFDLDPQDIDPQLTRTTLLPGSSAPNAPQQAAPGADQGIEDAFATQAALEALLHDEDVSEVAEAGPSASASRAGDDDESFVKPSAQAPDDEPTDPYGVAVGAGAFAAAPQPIADDHIEAAALNAASQSPSQTLPFAPVKAIPRDGTSESCRISGSGRATGALVWGSRSDVGHVREHNEDSYLINFPLFAVADGMGGHAAGEVASTITVSSLAASGVTKADPYALASAVERANREVIDGARQGIGRDGMGTTCTAVLIDGTRMAVAHVGDSRAYLLHGGKLLRVTHDHSFVEELVEAGQITPDEARVHPSRSIITRALGSDVNMRADAFTVNVTQGDRVLLCSDGLSSMVPDASIEETMVTSPTPQACADRLVNQALASGGHDNVSVVVVDVSDDGIERHALRKTLRNIGIWLLALAVAPTMIAGGLAMYARNSWYLTDSSGLVALYRGMPGSIGPLMFSEQVEVTNIEVSKLSEAIEQRLVSGITFRSEDDARAVLEQYRSLIARADRDAASGSAATSSTDGLTAVRPDTQAQG